jgi:hypothetical protein
LSKEVLDFDLGEGACPVNEMVKDTFIITNTTPTKCVPRSPLSLYTFNLELLLIPPAWFCFLGRTRVKFHFEPASMGHCKLLFEPSSGTIGAGAVRSSPAPASDCSPGRGRISRVMTSPKQSTPHNAQKNKGTKKIIAKLTLSNSEPVNFRVNLKITGIILSQYRLC